MSDVKSSCWRFHTWLVLCLTRGYPNWTYFDIFFNLRLFRLQAKDFILCLFCSCIIMIIHYMVSPIWFWIHIESLKNWPELSSKLLMVRSVRRSTQIASMLKLASSKVEQQSFCVIFFQYFEQLDISPFLYISKYIYLSWKTCIVSNHNNTNCPSSL